jgi:hypothetical protein
MTPISPAVSAIAYIDPKGTVLAGNTEWQALMDRGFGSAEPPATYTDVWDNLSNGASGVAHQLDGCLKRCRESDQPSHVEIAYWRTVDEYCRWHITMQRGQPGGPTAEVMVFHSDLVPLTTQEQKAGWADDLSQLLVHRRDMIVFEHDLEGAFTRFDGAESLLGYSDADRRAMHLDRLVAPQHLNFVIETVLAMQDRPGWTAVYESQWMAAGLSAKRVLVTSRIASDSSRSLAVRGIAQFLDEPDGKGRSQD